jgi:hypothetical protein
MEIVRKEEDGDDEEEELKTILFYQFEYIPNQTPKVCACFFCSLYFFFVLVNTDLKRNNTLFSSDFGAKENGEQMDIHHFAPRFRLTWIKRRYCIWLCIG